MVLIVHTRYRQAAGEDAMVDAQEALAATVRTAWPEADACVADVRAAFDARFTGAARAAAILDAYREAATRGASRRSGESQPT